VRSTESGGVSAVVQVLLGVLADGLQEPEARVDAFSVRNDQRTGH